MDGVKKPRSAARVAAGKKNAKNNGWFAFLAKKGVSGRIPKRGSAEYNKLRAEYDKLKGGNPLTGVAADLIHKKEKDRIDRVAKFLGFGMRGPHKGMLKFQKGGSIFWQHPSVTAGHWVTDKITGKGFVRMPKLTGNFHWGPQVSGKRMMEMALKGEGIGQHWEVVSM